MNAHHTPFYSRLLAPGRYGLSYLEPWEVSFLSLNNQNKHSYGLRNQAYKYRLLWEITRRPIQVINAAGYGLISRLDNVSTLELLPASSSDLKLAFAMIFVILYQLKYTSLYPLYQKDPAAKDLSLYGNFLF
jgi:hypothetical protein